MFFQHNNTTYAVKFYRNGHTTYAELFCVDEVQGLVSLSYIGMSRPYKNDPFVKSTGRKIALTHLMENLREVSEEVYNKVFRAKAWKSYFLRHAS